MEPEVDILTIWDLHCHPQDPRIQGRTLMEKTETLIRVADRMGIERLGLFLRPTNEKEIRDVLTHHRNRVFGFLWMTLWNETVDSHISALNRWVRDGPMVGMKIAGGDGVCSLAVYEPIYRYAGEINAGIYIHTWLKVGGDPVVPGGRDVPHESKPQDVAALAAKHPDITFMCGHTGGDWEFGVRAVRRVRMYMWRSAEVIRRAAWWNWL
jgi:predicted TIM-barrel fold metal-dependent hydrolase